MSTSWHSLGVIYIVKNGELSFLVQRVRSRRRKYRDRPPQVKFPGGGWKPGDLSSRHTLAREIFEEFNRQVVLPDDAVVDKFLTVPKTRTHVQECFGVPFGCLVGELPSRYEEREDDDSILDDLRFEEYGNVGLLFPTHQAIAHEFARHIGFI